MIKFDKLWLKRALPPTSSERSAVLTARPCAVLDCGVEDIMEYVKD